MTNERVEEIRLDGHRYRRRDGEYGTCGVCGCDVETHAWVLWDALAQAERERERLKADLQWSEQARGECLLLIDQLKIRPSPGSLWQQAEAEVERLKNAPQGTNSWRSCGHIAWGTCSTCYVERGEKLSQAEAALTRVRAALRSRIDTCLCRTFAGPERGYEYGRCPVCVSDRATLEGR